MARDEDNSDQAATTAPAEPVQDAEPEQTPATDEAKVDHGAESRPQDEHAVAVPEAEAAEPENKDVIDMSRPELYKWCKIAFEPTEEGAQNYYFQHFDTQVRQWEEPTEPYWIWDAMTQNVHASGLQIPEVMKQAHANVNKPPSSEPDPDYQGYNPKIHGSYDPNAPYAKYHEQKRAEEQLAEAYGEAKIAQQVSMGSYDATGTFNRFTGGFQGAEKSTERHNDANKSGRQLNAYFDVDAAANQHDGRSLKEERRSQKLSKKEIKELTQKRREKKEKKRLDFYKS